MGKLCKTSQQFLKMTLLKQREILAAAGNIKVHFFVEILFDQFDFLKVEDGRKKRSFVHLYKSDEDHLDCPIFYNKNAKKID